MRRFWRAVGLVALLATQACWLQAGGGPQRQGYTGLETAVTAANVADLTEVWTTTAGGAPREALVDGARAYIRTPGGLQALDVRTGARVWTTAGTATIGGDRLPVVVGDTLYVPDVSNACWLTQVDADTGAIVDRQLVSQVPAGPPYVSACPAGDALKVGSTVVMHWSYVFLMPDPMCTGTSILSYSTFGVTAVDVDGGPGGWAIEAAHPDGKCGLPNGDHLNNEASSREPGSILIKEGDYVRQAVCSGEGCPEGWRTPRPPAPGRWNDHPPVVVGNGDVAAATSYDVLVVIDGTTHAVEWTGEVGSAIGNRPLASDPETIFATTSDGRLIAFPIDGCGGATCAPSWTAALPAPASARPSIGGGVVYVGSEDGSVSAFDAGGCGAPTCSPLWTGSTPAKVTGAPTVANGRIIVGSSNGVVTAFALPEAAA